MTEKRGGAICQTGETCPPPSCAYGCNFYVHNTHHIIISKYYVSKIFDKDLLSFYVA